MQNCDAGMGSIALQGSMTDVRPYGYLNARYSGHGIAPADMLTVSDGGVYAIIFFFWKPVVTYVAFIFHAHQIRA